jgi:hypothetical protein
VVRGQRQRKLSILRQETARFLFEEDSAQAHAVGYGIHSAFTPLAGWMGGGTPFPITSDIAVKDDSLRLLVMALALKCGYRSQNCDWEDIQIEDAN